VIALRQIEGEWRTATRGVAHWFHPDAESSRCGKVRRTDTEPDDSAMRCAACWNHWCNEAKQYDDGV